MSDRTVVVGASLAGVRAAEALRRHGEDGPIAVVGAEAHVPYDRPPLSKKVLSDPGRDPLELTALQLAADQGLDWHLGTSAIALDLDRRRITLDDGEELPWDHLVVATGAHARTLALAGTLERVHTLRTLDDARELRASLAGGPAVAIVGAGFVGLEVASSCHQLGLQVSVVEALQVPLERSVGAVVGARVAERHREAGIRVETGVGVAALEGGAGVEAVRLSDGRIIDADVVVVGVGVIPTDAWLEGSGVDLADGVRCDARLRVLSAGRPVPGVVAAGDVARWDHPRHAAPVRYEHWTNAAEQGEAAARTLLHGDEAAVFDPIPYFWSDQLGAKLQMVGETRTGDAVAFVDDDGRGPRWLAAFGRDDRLVAAVGCGRPARVMALRRQIDSGSPFPPAP